MGAPCELRRRSVENWLEMQSNASAVSGERAIRSSI